MKNHIKLAAATSLALLFSAESWAGPVILGGDDLTDHGSQARRSSCTCTASCYGFIHGLV